MRLTDNSFQFAGYLSQAEAVVFLNLLKWMSKVCTPRKSYFWTPRIQSCFKSQDDFFLTQLNVHSFLQVTVWVNFCCSAWQILVNNKVSLSQHQLQRAPFDLIHHKGKMPALFEIQCFDQNYLTFAG